MSTYCNVADVKERLGYGVYRSLTNDTAQTPNGDLLTAQIIDSIDAYMREQLYNAYEDPSLLEGSEIVKLTAVELVVCRLLKRQNYNGIPADKQSEQMRACENAKAWLSLASQGMANIRVGGSVVTTKATAFPAFKVDNANSEVFDYE